MYLHREVRAAEIRILSTQRDSLGRDPDFTYTKNSRATEMAFYLHKDSKIFRAARAHLLRIY